MALPRPSPFLCPGIQAKDGNLALIALSRQSTIPALLRAANTSNPTDEITNTRFGSFPHSTLLGSLWGCQVKASKVDARDKRRGKKRKRDEDETSAATPAEDEDGIDTPTFEAAASGFAYILPPTPELWTASLPHRTQVVYTPDYSYILQRLKVRPGSTIIEAGAGSGSFTHAAARAVFNGYPKNTGEEGISYGKPESRIGKVYSFEYHEIRYEQLKQEIKDHGLDGIVQITHRDVYEEGFLLPGGLSPQATAVFLDLPAPWMALPYLRRSPTSPLKSTTSVYICTFSPCIEQVQQTVSTLRKLGWVEIDMVEIQHKRLDVRRERVGLQEEGLRCVNAVPASVDEALGRLRQLEDSQAEFHKNQQKLAQDYQYDGKHKKKDNAEGTMSAKQVRAENNRRELRARKIWNEGMLVHRTEPELKTHTSYLVFAVLPMEWTEEDEETAARQWSNDVTNKLDGPTGQRDSS